MIGKQKKLIAAALFVAAAFIAGLITGREQIQDRWNRERLAQKEAFIKQEQEHRRIEAEWNQQLQEAQNNATQRENVLRGNIAAANAIADRLRNIIHTISLELPYG